MNLKTILMHVGTASVTASTCYLFLLSPTNLSEKSVDELPEIPTQAVPRAKATQSTFRQITWAELDTAESIQEWAAGLNRFGMNSDYIRALVPLKQKKLLAANSQQPYHQRRDDSLAAEQRRAQLEVEEFLAKLDPTPKAPEGQLKFLNTDRLAQVLEPLKPFDAELHALEHRNADGVWESEDWDRFEALKRQRQDALLQQFTPEEKRQWITQESPEADELRARYVDLSKAQFDQVAEAKYEANQALAAQKITDEERSRVNAALESKIKGTLGDEGYQQFKRAEDPYYSAFWSLGEKLGLDSKSVNFAFDWQSYVQQADATLRQQGLPDEAIEARMKPVADQAKAALQQALGADAFRRFSEMPQSMFLGAYEPLTSE